jgi:hypothetical protein
MYVSNESGRNEICVTVFNGRRIKNWTSAASK